MLVQNKLGRTSFLKLVQKNKLLIQSGENRTMKIMQFRLKAYLLFFHSFYFSNLLSAALFLALGDYHCRCTVGEFPRFLQCHC